MHARTVSGCRLVHGEKDGLASVVFDGSRLTSEHLFPFAGTRVHVRHARNEEEEWHVCRMRATPGRRAGETILHWERAGVTWRCIPPGHASLNGADFRPGDDGTGVFLRNIPPHGRGRDARPGEDWSKARCRHPHWRPAANTWTCCFCGQPITPDGGFAAHLGKEHAHYDCAPGLGLPVVGDVDEATPLNERIFAAQSFAAAALAKYNTATLAGNPALAEREWVRSLRWIDRLEILRKSGSP